MDSIYAVLIFVGTPAAFGVTVWAVAYKLQPLVGSSLAGFPALGLFFFGPLLAETVLFNLPALLMIWSLGVWVGLFAGGVMALTSDFTPLFPDRQPHAHGDLWHEHAHEGLHYHPHGEHDTTHVLTKEGT